VAASAWHGVELRHFVALEAIARERSFSAAAASLGYTQSAISGQIAALERAIGASLFDRLPGSRGVEVTPEGRVLLEHVAVITSRLSAAKADIDTMRTGGPRSDELRIGTFQSVAMTLLPEILARLQVANPEVRPVLREHQDVAVLLGLVERGELDVAFTALPLWPGPFDALDLLRDPYVLIVHPDHPLADEPEPVPLARLGELPLITLERCSAQQLAEDGLRAAGVAPNVVTRMEDCASIVALVDARLGFALVPSLVAAYARDMRVLDLDARMAPRHVGLAWHSDRLRTSGMESFIAAAQQVAPCFERPANLTVL
jgi:DNA-binding transcriptional LysR family regulator